MIIYKIDFTKDNCYDELYKSLIRIMRDSKKVTNDICDEVCIVEKVEEMVSEVMAGMNGKWKKASGKRTGGKVGDGGATANKIKKPINKKDDDGNCL